MWGIGVLGYVVAVAGRTSLGVAGIEAMDRFEMGASALSAFAMVQLVVYAVAQLPVGLLADRIGSRRVIASGLVVLSAGQVLLAFAPAVPVAIVARFLIGLGDAAVLICVMRLIPFWFRPRLAPLLIQLTGMLGQLGQIVSAFPFLFLLLAAGWTTAFSVLGGVGFLVAALVVLLVRDRPASAPPASDASRQGAVRSLAGLFREPGAWLGLFAHYVTLFPANVFLLLWGVPFLRGGEGRSAAEVSALLVIGTLGAFLAAPVLAELFARFPGRRSATMMAVAALTVAVWATVLLPEGPRPFAHLAVLTVTLSLGVVACTMAFDFPRTLVPHHLLGAASGMVNIGGYTATVVGLVVVGAVLDARSPSGAYVLADFAWAFAALLPLMGIGVAGLLVCRRLVRLRSGVRA